MDNEQQSPKQIIESIRKIRFGIGLDTNNISEDVRAHIEDNKKFKNAAARLASELQTEKPHFILELIQNAEDNEYDENVEPMVKFIIEDNKLILQNNEKGYKEENVWALCGIGETTKQNKKAGYIGEKGIGFKSVFMVSNEPHIYSNGFQFKFEYDEKNPITIIIPHWIDIDNIPNYINLQQTNIVLPLKDEVKTELVKFTNIDPCLLLFLRKLRYIEIEDKIQEKSWAIERHDCEGKVKIVYLGKKDYWRIVKSPEPIKVPSHIKEEKRKEITETEIVLAFPLESDGSAETSKEQKVFVYLPVRSYGFKFIIQADFLMPPTREDIHKDESKKSWNKWLRDNIASIFLRAVEEFKSDEKLKKTYYNFIPLTNEISDTFFSPVAEQIQNNLREAQCILTESNNWLKPRDVFMANKEIRTLIPNEDLKRFFNKEYISVDIIANKDILYALGVSEFEFGHLVQCLKNEKWLKEQNDEWFTNLYTYLNNQKLEAKQMDELKNLRIIRLENNELASITEKPIFFPLDKKDDYGFEKELRILKRTIFEPKEKEVVRVFLKKIGVEVASPYEIIEHHILPIYESEEWKNKDSNTLKGYIRYIKDNIEAYEKESDNQLNSNKRPWETKEDPLGRLKKSLYIRIIKNVDRSEGYDLPQNVYLPNIFNNENNLEILFDGIDGISFVHQSYIDDIIKTKREAEIKKWKEFFLKLEVENCIRIQLYNRDYYNFQIKSDDLKKIIDTKDINKITIAIKILDTNWNRYSNFINVEERYIPYRCRTYHYRTIKTEFYKLLLENPCFPTANGLMKPSEAFLDKKEIRDFLGDTVPYLTLELKNEEFIKALGINTTANVEGVLNHLKILSEQKCKEKDIFIKLYNFLNKNYEGNENTIKTAFSENKLIYIPNTTQSYFSNKEVIWKDVSEIFGENRGYLEKHFSELKSFFVGKLGISEKPTPQDYASVLISLSRKEKVEEKDEKIILKIYSELNSHLNPEINEHLISEEDWWQDFINKPIFWTDKNEFRKNDGNVFVNDNPELYSLFRNIPQIAFLKLPSNYHPKIQHFIREVGVPYLTKVVENKLANGESAKIDQNLTEQIRKFTPYLLRYIYKVDYNIFKRFKEEGAFIQFIKLKVYSVDSLYVKYTLNNHQSANTKRNAILYDGNLYVQKDYLEDTDRLAVEISKLFGEIRGLDDFLISLFNKKEEEKIINLLSIKGIQELPEDEIKWFEEVKREHEVIEKKEGMNATDKENIPTPPISKVPLTPTPPEIPAETERNIGEEQIEKTGWQPEFTPTDIEKRVEVLQVSRNSEHEISKKENIHKKPQSPTNTLQVTERDNLTQEAKMAIGRWGEEYTLECLKYVLSKKYPKGVVTETEDGFTIIYDDKKQVEVHWLNKNGDKGEGYDIKVIENGNEEYIEVKSTKTDTKDWFDVSNKQWEFIQEKGDKFHIYRIYNAGTKDAKLVDIHNPMKLWQEGNLVAYPIRIQI